MIKRSDKILRWVVLALAIVQFVVLYFLLSHLSSVNSASLFNNIYFLPVTYTYYIWIPIILSGFVYAVVQALPFYAADRVSRNLVFDYGVLYLGLSVWMYLTVFTGEYFSPEFKPNYLFASLIVAFIMLYSANRIYFNVDKTVEKFLVFKLSRQVMISHYLSWLLATSIGLVSSYFYAMSFNSLFSSIGWGVFLIGVLSILTLNILYRTKSLLMKYIFGGSVVWALFGLIQQNIVRFNLIALSASICALFILGYLGYLTVVRKTIKNT